MAQKERVIVNGKDGLAAAGHQLSVTTPTDREIVMTRVFDAPRELVFDAFTTPEIVQQWLLAPEGWSLAVCDIDLRVGGAFRYVWRSGADGQEFVVSGVYTEIARPARVVHTEQFDDPAYPGESVETWTFDERDGVTTFTTTLSYDSIEARRAALESGMDQGNAACYDRLAALLAQRHQRNRGGRVFIEAFVDPSREQLEAFRAIGRAGPIQMLNLVRFRERAQYADGREATGAQAYREYAKASADVFTRVGGRQHWIGRFEQTVIGPESERWDAVFIAEYPSAAAFMAMLRDPVYREAVKHRQAAVETSRLIRLAPTEGGVAFGESGGRAAST